MPSSSTRWSKARRHQVTDGMSDALYPVFDKNGKYLYFTASTDIALATAASICRATSAAVTRSVYVGRA